MRNAAGWSIEMRTQEAQTFLEWTRFEADVTFSPAILSGKQPFRLNDVGAEIFSHPSWTHAEQTVLASVAGNGHVLLLGVAGTGKTMLIQTLAATLNAAGRTARLLRYCDKIDPADPAEVLLVDEAGMRPPEQLELLCRLPNPVVLAGLPGLEASLGAIADVTHIVTLEPLTQDETARFITTRLGECGLARDLFSPQALSALSQRSDGLFRLVVILAGAALFFAHMRASERVEAADVEEAASMRISVDEEAEAEPIGPAPLPPARLRSRLGWRQVTATGLTLLVAGSAYGLTLLRPPPAPSLPTAGFAAVAPLASAPIPLATVAGFSGPIVDDTMGVRAYLSLQLRALGRSGPIGAWFHVTDGLIGAGALTGKMNSDGQLTLTGRLMFGQNPFDCALHATMQGSKLIGEATFVRVSNGVAAHSSFNLDRS